MTKKLMFGALGLCLAAAIAGGPSLIALAQTAPADAIKARKDNRQQVRTTMGAIKKIVDDKGPGAEIVPLANRVAELERTFLPLFPAGSDQGDTKALPTVWSDRAGFEAASKATEDAALRLAQVAGTGDASAVSAAFGDLAKTCGACHDKFRAK